MTEFEETIVLATKILDRINADPDDDLAKLSRQFLRAVERVDVLDQALGDEIASRRYTNPGAQHTMRVTTAAKKIRQIRTAIIPPAVCGHCFGTGEVCYSSTSYGPCPECVGR